MAVATKKADYSAYEAALAALLQQDKDENNPPAGAFNVKVRKIEWSLTKKGAPMVSVQGEITGPINEGRILFPRAGLWAKGATGLNEMSIALGLPPVLLFGQASAIAAGRLTLVEATAELKDEMDDETYFNAEVTHKTKKAKSDVTNEPETTVDVSYRLTPYSYITG